MAVELGKSPSITVVISTGRNHIDRMTVKLSSFVTFRCQDVVLLETRDFENVASCSAAWLVSLVKSSHHLTQVMPALLASCNQPEQGEDEYEGALFPFFFRLCSS